MLLTNAVPWLVIANFIISLVVIVNGSEPDLAVSLTVTTLVLTVAVKVESASINVFKFVAVWLLLDVVWNFPEVAEVAELKVVIEPSDLVSTSLELAVILA